MLPLVRWLSVLALALTAPIVAGSCSRGARTRAPNVVLLVIDTLRADHVTCYGYPLPTTPNMDDFARVADRYTRAESAAPWTLPSHASMFTGRFAFEHGARTMRASDGEMIDANPLRAEELTLAEALAAVGYRTGGFVGNSAFLTSALGFSQGFEIYDVARRPAREIDQRLFSWIDGLDRERPFFAFVNYIDVHRPYNVEPLPTERAKALPTPAAESTVKMFDELYAQVLGRGEEPDRKTLSKLVTQYDNGLAWADLAVGEVIAHLKAAGSWENTLLIVTSDHGEYFGEHQLIEHSKDVYEPVLSVPLFVHRPGQSAGVVRDERTSLVEIPRLVFAALPQELQRAQRGAFGLDEEGAPPVLAEVHFARPKDLAQSWGKRFDRERTALYSDRYKFILSSDGANELYDLDDDPDENHNLVGSRPELVGLMESRVHAIQASSGSASAAVRADLDLEQQDELRKLGY